MSTIITDDGQGFDHEKDENGMNAFDKYFVFGNSYDTTNGKGLSLGQMGIGGKLQMTSFLTKLIFTGQSKQKIFMVNAS